MSGPAHEQLQAHLDGLVVTRLWAVLVAFEARLAQELAELDLTVPSFRLIGELMRSPEGLGQAELARRLGVRPPTVSAAVTRLVERGLVERGQDPSDSRAYLVRLSSDAPLANGVEVLERVEADLVGGLGPEARTQLLELLDQINLNT